MEVFIKEHSITVRQEKDVLLIATCRDLIITALKSRLCLEEGGGEGIQESRAGYHFRFQIVGLSMHKAHHDYKMVSKPIIYHPQHGIFLKRFAWAARQVT